jgi:hypothetical protein
MTRSLRALLLAGVATIGLGLMPGLAAAGQRGDWNDRGRRGEHSRGYSDHGHKKWRGDDRHARDSRKHGGHKQPSYRQHGHQRHYAKRDRDDDHLLPAILIGAVGLTAIMLASQSQAAAPRPQPVTYVQPPAPAPYPVTVAQAPDWQSASCLMTREYQTQITVGGRLVDAYGQACMQPDGSWLKGPAQAVPY